jgi:CRP/FNR family nitrogen fixation transcriptional regulator
MSVQSVFEIQRPITAPTAGRDLGDAPLALEGMVSSYGRDEEIFGEGERADEVYQVLSGVVRTYRLLSDGRRQLEAFLYAGDCFGLEMGAEHRVTAEAVGDVTVRSMRRSLLADRAAADIELARKLWRLAAGDLRRSQDHVMMLGRRSAAERLAGFLLDLVQRTGAKALLDLPMSRQDIADFLGLTIETVSRTFTYLQGLALIDIQACRRIRICDAQALEEICA